MLEQSDTITDQYGHEVNLYFVKKSSLYVLLSGIRAHQSDIFVTCGCFGLFKGAFDTVSDEGKRRSSFLGQLFSSIMRKYKTRHLKGRVIVPRPLPNAERSSAHHNCPCSSE